MYLSEQKFVFQHPLTLKPPGKKWLFTDYWVTLCCPGNCSARSKRPAIPACCLRFALWRSVPQHFLRVYDILICVLLPESYISLDNFGYSEKIYKEPHLICQKLETYRIAQEMGKSKKLIKNCYFLLSYNCCLCKNFRKVRKISLCYSEFFCD